MIHNKIVVGGKHRNDVGSFSCGVGVQIVKILAGTFILVLPRVEAIHFIASGREVSAGSPARYESQVGTANSNERVDLVSEGRAHIEVIGFIVASLEDSSSKGHSHRVRDNINL
mmetsp:Transcript_3632/g.3582  ORF Transcript_3632/g.3582 Transcript_3632/m.3582 type:complete len:114 (+) Transcript_3632:217-558(+)